MYLYLVPVSQKRSFLCRCHPTTKKDELTSEVVGPNQQKQRPINMQKSVWPHKHVNEHLEPTSQHITKSFGKNITEKKGLVISDLRQ
ncbi:unnamed protein product [Linum trigynum]|uniref:Uncharacterized protein n=1 Tax=Linum trigynum TaxID=586398 RepID=A0AAV2FD54_9ROSI